MSRFVTIFLLVSTLSSTLAWAWPPTYGLELNLVNRELERVWQMRIDQLGDDGQNPQAQDEHRIAKELMSQLQASCQPECVVEEKIGKFGLREWNFKFQTGFSFNLSVDPATVEIQVGPWSLEQWKSHAPEIQKWLFDFTKSRGFKHSLGKRDENSAHLNIGLRSAFDGDGRAFARYLADYWQHPELVSGVLGQDEHNAPPLGYLSRKQQAAAKEILESVNHSSSSLAEMVARRIQAHVYTDAPGHEYSAYHYQAVGLKYVTKTASLKGEQNSDQPFELRANRSPESAEQALLQLELQERRLAWLRTQASEPVVFELAALSLGDDPTVIAKQDLVTGFYLYLDEMGLADEFGRYRKLLPSELRRVEPWSFAIGGFRWSDTEARAALERFAPRARSSARVRQILKDALLLPHASRSVVARQILAKLGSWALSPGQPLRVVNGSAPVAPPPVSALSPICLEVIEKPSWSKIPEFEALRKELESWNDPEVRLLSQVLSACQAAFAKGYLP
ncbi:MAG: hypothetical protein RJB38_2398 [Pseudomonadota bacterium]